MYGDILSKPTFEMIGKHYDDGYDAKVVFSRKDGTAMFIDKIMPFVE